MQESSPNRQSHQKPVSIPEQELLGFVSAASELVGSEQSNFLREVWLDELASMETMPAPTSSEWRMVTVAALARLAQRLVDIRIMTALDRAATAVQDKFYGSQYQSIKTRTNPHGHRPNL